MSLLSSMADFVPCDRLLQKAYSARAQVLHKNKRGIIQRLFYLLNVRPICTILLHKWIQCIDGFILLLQRYVRKGNDAKNPAILSFCLSL